MNIFPHTPVYVVTFWPGASGSFLASLIASMIGYESTSKFSKHGNIHKTGGVCLNSKSVGIKLSDFDYLNHNFDYPPSILCTEPNDPTKPLIIREHQAHHDILFEKYPLAKNIIIQYEKSERLVVELNAFYKIYIDDWDANEDHKKHWYETSKLSFNGIKNPKDVPEDMLMKQLKIQAENRPPYPFEFGDFISNDPRIFTINLKEIYSNYRKTLNTLSTMTGRRTNRQTAKLYIDYIDRQQTLWNKVNYNPKL